MTTRNPSDQYRYEHYDPRRTMPRYTIPRTARCDTGALAMAAQLRVGDVLHGFCGGHFGRDSYDDKRVEAIGSDWVIARSGGGGIWLYRGDPEQLTGYRQQPGDEDRIRDAMAEAQDHHPGRVVTR